MASSQGAFNSQHFRLDGHFKKLASPLQTRSLGYNYGILVLRHERHFFSGCRRDMCIVNYVGLVWMSQIKSIPFTLQQAAVFHVDVCGN